MSALLTTQLLQISVYKWQQAKARETKSQQSISNTHFSQIGSKLGHYCLYDN